MKKRNILLMFGMCCMLAFTACGATDSDNNDKQDEAEDDDADEVVEGTEIDEKALEGKWIGTFVFSKYTIMENIAVENVSYDVLLTFDDENVTYKITEEAKSEFVKQVKERLGVLLDQKAAELAANQNMTVDEFYEYMETDRESELERVIEECDIADVPSDLCERIIMTGTYESDGEKITVTGDREPFQVEWEYELSGNEMKIKFNNGEMTYEATFARR